MFQDLRFDISFADALFLMPRFAPTIRDLLMNKEKLLELVKILLNENCSAMLLKKLPEKLGDPGKFLIPCEFPGMEICHALADLGASINLIPLSIWKKLSLPKLSPTRMTLELANRSITYPKGLAKDVYVKVGKFHFLADFVVVDFEADPRVPLILEELITYLYDKIHFYGSDHDDCDPEEDIYVLEQLLNDDPFQLPPMDLKQSEVTEAKSSIEEPPDLELKDLPSHLEYAFLRNENLWVSPIHCVPKKGGMTVVANEENELIPTRLVTGWRVCIDYRKLHEATRKDHFPLPFMDQMQERLAGNEFYCFLDGFSGFFQIPIDPHDQEKMAFTCSYGHAGFYRRFIQDFSKISRPITHLLEKDTPFVFSQDCINAFETLKKKLTEAPILVVPDWNLPFELMCDASDFAIGAVLGQRKTKHFQPIHYASKTMTEAQIHYTTTEKEMLAVVYAFEKFRPYLVLSKSIVYTDHSALKYLMNKQDAKPQPGCSECCVTHTKFDITILVQERSENLADQFICRDSRILTKMCVHGHEALEILKACHEGPTGGHHSANLTAQKVEAKALTTNDARVAVKFLNSLFARFGTPRAIISDCGTHFCNDQFAKVMFKYEVTHRLATAYHPQTSGQVEVLNCGLKRILGRTIGENRASCSYLWGMLYLPVELEHKAYWALKHVNFDLKTAGDHRKLQLNELNELRDQAYENSLIYKEKTKKLHDSKIKNRIFNVVELSQPDGPNFKVNGHRVKHYFGGDIPPKVLKSQDFLHSSLRTTKFRDRVELVTRIDPTSSKASRVRCCVLFHSSFSSFV
ncbi:reverse transcriptase domain-containing protein [Tanacetum coccineum]|uniref:Reverse transcriptase domain-containing protein n=1 Tax=Tanacetum coccineum TaxID=301880 RepID=A0ABQ5I8A9_9ASTR